MDPNTLGLIALIFAFGVPLMILYITYRILMRLIRGVAKTTRRTHAVIIGKPVYHTRRR